MCVVFCLTDVCLADCADLWLSLSDGCVLVKANFSEAGGLRFCLGTILNCNDCYWQLFLFPIIITQILMNGSIFTLNNSYCRLFLNTTLATSDNAWKEGEETFRPPDRGSIQFEERSRTGKNCVKIQRQALFPSTLALGKFQGERKFSYNKTTCPHLCNLQTLELATATNR